MSGNPNFNGFINYFPNTIITSISGLNLNGGLVFTQNVFSIIATSITATSITLQFNTVVCANNYVIQANGPVQNQPNPQNILVSQLPYVFNGVNPYTYYTFNGLLPVTSYTFTITTYNAQGQSLGSFTSPLFLTCPAGVTNISYQTIGINNIVLTFNPASGATSYSIMAINNITPTQTITQTVLDSISPYTPYNFINLASGTSYTFKITSIGPSGPGLSTTSGSFVTDAAAVQNVVTTPILNGIIFTFTPAFGATSYLFAASNILNSVILNQTAYSSPYTFNNLSSGAEYIFAITSYDISGAGGVIKTPILTTLSLNIFNFIAISTTPTSVTLSWVPSSSGISYVIINWVTNGAGNTGIIGNWTSGNIPVNTTSYTASVGIAGNPTITFTITGYTSTGSSGPSVTYTVYYDGSTASLAAISPVNIMTAYTARSQVATDGVYWIYLAQAPTPYAVQSYCLMNPNITGGGGYMMAMKATTGTTFNYNSSHWTTATASFGNNDRRNEDAKFDIMNYYYGSELLALWPDILTTGGSLGTNPVNNPYGCWTWQQNYGQLYGSSTMINLFGSSTLSTVVPNIQGSGTTFSGYGYMWSTEGGANYYGFNIQGTLYNQSAGSADVRWGFGFNNESDLSSCDVTCGIGMSTINYSAGDYIWYNCCCTQTGINRSARVEIYLRSSASYLDGSTAALAAPSALAIIQSYAAAGRGVPADGVYWINLPTIGATQIYCIMNPNVNGGGWMMAMKATTGTTFNYSSPHWTTVTTLNPADTTRNNADAKFHTMNYYAGSELLALWPDILTNGGSLGTNTTTNPYGCWTWQQNYSQFRNNVGTTMISLFNSVTNYSPCSYSAFSGWNSSFWSSESGNNFYGFNFTYYPDYVRWGFGFNNETDWGSDDVSGGIGMSVGNYSAGDYYGCCGTIGINRSARVEIYVR